MDLSIIVVNWKSKDYLRKCLHSIYANTHKLIYEIIVIDGASFDGCADMLNNEFPSVVFIQSATNVGFAKANNIAFQRSTGQNVLFLNPDTEIVGTAINILFDALCHLKNVGAVGARLLNSDGSLQTSCIQSFPTVLNQFLDTDVLRRIFPRLSLWGMASLYAASDEPSEVEAIVGACILMRRELFDQLGGFDEGYFMYAEDIDLSFRIHERGLNCWYQPKATIVHHGGGCSKSARSNFATVMMRESIYRFMRIRRGELSAQMFRLCIALLALLRLPLAAALIFCPGKTAHAMRSSVSKWAAVLRWSLGLELWSRR